MESHRRGIAVTMVSQWFRLAIQVVGFVVLSRLLLPADFGLIAMIAAILAFATIFADFGLSLAALQAKTLSAGQRSNLFWLNASAGLVAGCILAASGPVLAAFYGDQRVVAPAVVLASSLVLGGLTTQFRVQLTRARRFQALALHDVIGATLGIVLAIVAALAGLGFWSLVVQSVSQAAVLLFLALAGTSWRPGIPQRNVSMAGFIGFGGDTFLLQILNLVSRSVDTIALGRYRGAAEVGLYARSHQLVNMTIQQFISPLTRVVLPRLASERDPNDFNRLTVRLTGAIALAGGSTLSLIIALAPSLLVLAIGPNWAPMIPVVQILSVAAWVQTMGYIFYWTMLAQGRSRLLLLAELPGRTLMVGLFLLIASQGMEAIAVSVLGGQAAILLGAFVAARRWTPIDTSGISTTAWPTSLAFIGAGVSAAIVSEVAANLGMGLWMQLALSLIGWTTGVAAALTVRKVRQSIIAALRDVASLRRR